MITSDLIKEVYTVYRGKIESKTPTFGSDKSNVAVRIANRKIREWARDTKVSWNSLFNKIAPNEPGTVATTGTTTLTGTSTYFLDYKAGDKIIVDGETVRTIDTISSNTSLDVTVAFSNTASSLTFTRQTIIEVGVQEYKLHRNLYNPADKAIVYTTQDNNFDIVKPQARDIYNDTETYIYGLNPKTLAFSADITSVNPYLNGTLKVAGYYIPNDLVSATDEVPVDNPDWLVYAVAAELARNDAAKDDQFSNLMGMANELYIGMIQANMAMGYLQNNAIPNNMPRLGQNFDDWSL